MNFATFQDIQVTQDGLVALPGKPPVAPRVLFATLPQAEAALVARAVALAHWRQNTKFCPGCGAMLAPHESEVALWCEACHKAHYPRISPAIIVAVHKGDQLLLAHNASFPPGRHSLVAGFVEAGETLEAALEREVREEVRLEVCNVRYRHSQPWPFPDSLMLAFEAEWCAGEIVCDGKEITHAAWYRKDGPLPDLPPAGSVARKLIDAWLNS